MKLYYSPGACSLASHIALSEAGLAFELERVDIRAKKTAGGEDYRAINPKGSVPALRLDDGEVLTEGVAIMQLIGDKKPETKLVPPNGSLARYREQEWLNYISSELHKGVSPLFNPKLADDMKATIKETIAGRLAFVASSLGERPYLMGDDFTVADAYLYVIERWATRVFKMELPAAIEAHMERVKARPAVQKALATEAIEG
jgi:glutathione S-transferase